MRRPEDLSGRWVDNGAGAVDKRAGAGDGVRFVRGGGAGSEEKEEVDGGAVLGVGGGGTGGGDGVSEAAE